MHNLLKAAHSEPVLVLYLHETKRQELEGHLLEQPIQLPAKTWDILAHRVDVLDLCQYLALAHDERLQTTSHSAVEHDPSA